MHSKFVPALIVWLGGFSIMHATFKKVLNSTSMAVAEGGNLDRALVVIRLLSEVWIMLITEPEQPGSQPYDRGGTQCSELCISGL